MAIQDVLIERASGIEASLDDSDDEPLSGASNKQLDELIEEELLVVRA